MKTKLLIVLWFVSFCAIAQKEADKNAKPVPPPVMYGESISMELARKIASASVAFAVSNQWPVAVAIVDTGGNLVLFEKMDQTQVGSIDVAIGKAKTANNFKRPTKAMDDVVAAGGVGLRVLALPGALPIEGGEPIFLNGKIIGGIGVSGMSSGQDAEVARAGLAVLR